MAHLKGPSGRKKRMPSTSLSWKSMVLSLCMSSSEMLQPRHPSRLPRIWWGLLLLASTLLPRWMPHLRRSDSTCLLYLVAICFTSGCCTTQSKRCVWAPAEHQLSVQCSLDDVSARGAPGVALFMGVGWGRTEDTDWARRMTALADV